VLEHHGLDIGGQFSYKGIIEQHDLDSAWATLEQPTAVWMVNVAASALSSTVSAWLLQRWGVEVNVVGSTSQLCGVTNGYRIPGQLGADRWVAMIGAAHLYSGPCCVVDCGTAVTIDLLDQTHHHLGGLILPGLSLMPRCVIDATAIDDVMLTESERWGRDTASCLASGAIQAITSTMRQVAEDLQRKLEAPVSKVITGGDARHIVPFLGAEWVCEIDLVFIGLSRIALHNEGVR